MYFLQSFKYASIRHLMKYSQYLTDNHKAQKHLHFIKKFA